MRGQQGFDPGGSGVAGGVIAQQPTHALRALARVAAPSLRRIINQYIILVGAFTRKVYEISPV